MKLKILLTSLLLASSHVYALDTEKPQLAFTKSYQAYLKAVNNNDKDISFYAKESFELGKKLYQPNDTDLLSLAQNYAASLSEQNLEEKLKLYDYVLTSLKSKNKSSITLYDPLIRKAKLVFTTRTSDSIDLIDEAANIAEMNKQYELSSEAYFLAAQTLFKLNKYSLGRKYIKKADQINQEHLPENSVHRLGVDLWMSDVDTSYKKHNAALKRLNHIVDVFNKNLDFDHPYELAAHSRLVKLLEKKGRSEEATKHCIAIAKMKPWQDDIEQIPLYREEPKYPVSAARAGKEGTVQLSFVITESGFVENIKVLNTSSKKFNKSSINALSKWRYAPKFQNGKPVKADATVQLDYTLFKS